MAVCVAVINYKLIESIGVKMKQQAGAKKKRTSLNLQMCNHRQQSIHKVGSKFLRSKLLLASTEMIYLRNKKKNHSDWLWIMDIMNCLAMPSQRVLNSTIFYARPQSLRNLFLESSAALFVEVCGWKIQNPWAQLLLNWWRNIPDLS